jgi:hypothetical protein
VVSFVATQVKGESKGVSGRYLRVSGATLGVAAGILAEILKTVANWKSDAVWEYMRAARASSMRISEMMGFGTTLPPSLQSHWEGYAEAPAREGLEVSRRREDGGGTKKEVREEDKQKKEEEGAEEEEGKGSKGGGLILPSSRTFLNGRGSTTCLCSHAGKFFSWVLIPMGSWASQRFSLNAILYNKWSWRRERES